MFYSETATKITLTCFKIELTKLSILNYFILYFWFSRNLTLFQINICCNLINDKITIIFNKCLEVVNINI